MTHTVTGFCRDFNLEKTRQEKKVKERRKEAKKEIKVRTIRTRKKSRGNGEKVDESSRSQVW